MDATTSRRGLIPASFVLGGALLSLVGLSWDIQWHNDVGPDTFFTMPHLFLYAGSAVAGFASLAVVLSTTAAQRRGRPADPSVGGRPVGVFGRTFTAPVGYLISGTGAAGFLIYGLWDEWWHGLYGFDVTIASPPHIGFLLSIQITMVGALVVFTAARRHRWGRVGTILGAATLIAFSVVTVMGLEALPVDEATVVGAGVVFVCVVVVVMSAHALDGWGAIGVVAALAAMQAVLWWFSPWATVVYADAIGLPMRDFLEGVPGHAAMIPMVLVLVGVLAGVLRRLPAWSIGAIGGALIGGFMPVQEAVLYRTEAPDSLTVLVLAAVGTVVGGVAGFLGARFGQLLVLSAPEEIRHA